MMTTISVYSIPLSPAGAEFTAQRPQMQSTTLSLTGNLRSPTDNFPEQSSVLEPQCFPSLQLSFIYSLSDPDSVMNRSVHTSYKKDEEERLLTGLVIADLAIPGNPWEILRMLSDLGEVLLQQGRWKTAADVASRLVEGHKSRLASSSDDAEMLAALAVLGRARSHQGLLAEAERLFRRVIIGSSVNAHNDPCRILHLCLLAATVREQNKIEEAESVCRQAMEEAEKSHGLKHRFTLFTARFFSSLLQEQGRYEETEVILNKTLKLLKEVFGLEDAATLHCTDILAEVLSCQEKYKEAEEMQREVVAVAKKVFGPESSKTLEFMSRLSSGLAKQGRYEESEVVRRETLVLQKRFYGYEDTTTMLSLSRLGDLLEKQGKLEEAEAVFTETLALGRNLLGHKHPWTLSNIPRLRQVLECQGKFEESDSVQ
jgi:tetratricopeptide (TPR) repeat protein